MKRVLSFFLVTLFVAQSLAVADVEINERNESNQDSNTEDSMVSESYGVCVPATQFPGYYYIYFCSRPTNNPSRDCTYSTMSTRCGW